MFEKVIQIGLLFDFYGKLLSNKQYEAIELYYVHDLSLSEIGEQLDISRQGVHDLIKRGEKRLNTYEEKLGLVNKFNSNNKKIKKILDCANEINKDIDGFRKDTICDNILYIEKLATEILESNQEVK